MHWNSCISCLLFLCVITLSNHQRMIVQAECFTPYNNTNVRGGFNQPSITSEDACKSTCLSNQTCLGVDWNYVEKSCWFATNATDPTKYNQTGITHWDLNRACNAAVCFTPYNNTNVRGGFNQPSITSEDACKSTCLSNQTCLGVDWNYVEKSCWFATNATDPTKYNQTGITHWDLNRTCNAVNGSSTGSTTVPTSAGGSNSSVSTTLPNPSAGCFIPSNNTNVRGGFNQPLITSEDACKSTCLSNQTCLGVDWNYVEKSCWFATNATDPTKYNQTGITHWDLNSGCNTGSVTATTVTTPQTSSNATNGCFIAYNNTNVRGGFNQPLITSEDACKSTCLSNQTCLGVDWNYVEKSCWFATNATDPTKYNQTGITHWDLNTTCSTGSTGRTGTGSTISSPSTTLTFGAGCFTPYNNTNVRGGFNQPLITSEDACKSTCLSNQTCLGVDWNYVEKSCWFATNATDPTKYNQTGITHWDLNTTCITGPTTIPSNSSTATSTVQTLPQTTGPPSTTAVNNMSSSTSAAPAPECFIAYNNTNVRGGFNQPLITSEDACKSTCLSNQACVGIDWNSVDHGCWLATDTTDTTKYNQTGITHWDLNRTCNAVNSNSTGSTTGSTLTGGSNSSVSTTPGPTTSGQSGTTTASNSSNNATTSVTTGSPGSTTSSNVSTTPTTNNSTASTNTGTSTTTQGSNTTQTTTPTGTGTTTPGSNTTQTTTATVPSTIPPLVGCTYNWTLTNNSHVTGAVQQTAATTESACLSACEKNSSCVGVDWNIVSSLCYVITNLTDPTRINQLGINHWDVTKFCFDENSVKCSNVWSLTSDAYSTGDRLSIPASDETACRSACFSNPNCTGVDWTGNPSMCYLDLTSAATWTGGAKAHWDLTRQTNASCPSICTYRWALYPGRGYADAVPTTAADENQCRLACIRAWPNCVGLDYTSSGSCLLVLTNTSRLIDSPGTRHWSIEYMFQCGPCTNVWLTTPGVMDRNRVLVRSLTTVSDCRTACTNQPSCTGIEFVSNLCYLSNSKVFFVNVDDGFHSDIARSTCGSGCSGSWVLFPNTRSANEVPFGTNTTELDCKNGCVYDSNCTGIDYNATSRLCYLAYPGNFTSAVGINHFERIRDLNCVPSPDATTIGPGSLSSQSSLSSTTSNFTVTASNVTLKTTTIPTTILCPLWSPPFNDTSSFNCDFRGRNTTVASCQGFCLLEPTCVSINFNDANHMTPFDCYICLSSNLTFPPLYSNEHVVTYELLTPC